MNMQEDKPENAEVNELKAHYDFDYSQAKPNRFAACLAQEQLGSYSILQPETAPVYSTDSKSQSPIPNPQSPIPNHRQIKIGTALSRSTLSTVLPRITSITGLRP